MTKKLINNSNSLKRIKDNELEKLSVNDLKEIIKQKEAKIEELKKKIVDSKSHLAKIMKVKPNELDQKLKDILGDHETTPYEKKVALFNVVKNLDVGESQPLKEQRMNYLLESRLYGVLAKRALEDYRKATVKAFSKTKSQQQHF